MSNATYILGIHVSNETYSRTLQSDEAKAHSMHAFAEVVTLKDDAAESVLTRFKSNGFVAEARDNSMASETVIYAPITEEQAQAFKDFSALMLDLHREGRAPYQYQSAFEEGVRTGMNCVDMMILSCAVSGIDLDSLLALPDGAKVTSQTQNLKSATKNTQARPLGENDAYTFSAPVSEYEPLVFAEYKNMPQGPHEVFNMLCQNPLAMDILLDESNTYAFCKVQEPLPDKIVKAANSCGRMIPSSLLK